MDKYDRPEAYDKNPGTAFAYRNHLGSVDAMPKTVSPYDAFTEELESLTNRAAWVMPASLVVEAMDAVLIRFRHRHMP